MKQLCTFVGIFLSFVAGCGALGGKSDGAAGPVDLGIGPLDAHVVPVPVDAGEGAHRASAIRHLVVIVQENHSFDSYFGTWCSAAPGSNPTCTSGPTCCEAGPAFDPGSNLPPLGLGDKANAAFDPNHSQSCENAKMNGGRMDSYVTAKPLVVCGNPLNFAYASTVVAPYRNLAAAGALADRYFQPISGQSGSNLIYFHTARYLFTDNSVEPQAIGAQCAISFGATPALFTSPTLGDLLDGAGVSWAWYAEGYAAMKAAGSGCPTPPSGCPLPVPNFNPCTYDPATVAPAFFRATADNPIVMRDFSQLFADLAADQLPSVVFVRGLAFHTEHPGYGITITPGADFASSVVTTIAQSPAAASTLILLTYDESGGYFDHVAPPTTSAIDNQPYGPRVPLIATGPFARSGVISHTVMEHSSVVKFIEWNWLAGTGQLGARDTVVNNIGSLLDPAKTGVAVPEK